jgi:hypothetical protein
MKTHRFHTWARLLTQQSFITVNSLPFSVSVGMDMETWTWGHGHGDMDLET